MSGEKMREALMDNGRKAIYGVMRLARSLGNWAWVCGDLVIRNGRMEELLILQIKPCKGD